MKFRDNQGSEFKYGFQAMASNMIGKFKKNKTEQTNGTSREQYVYPDVLTTDCPSNCHKIEIDYNSQSIILKNDDGDVVITSKIDDVIMQNLSAIDFTDGIRYGNVDITPYNYPGYEEREEKLIDKCLTECSDDVKNLINASLNPTSDNYDFNNRLIECQSRILGSALSSDPNTVKEGGASFVKSLYDRLFKEMFTGLSEKAK